MLATTTRRLAGFRFEVQPPPSPDVLPRMDIAAFVGFAACGPLHVPVAIEDTIQFAAIFGDDAPLAWDTKRGEPARAHLASAVRAFFRNGGRRCWVIRVADTAEAETNRFPVYGLARANVINGRVTSVTPAFARARCPGSWSDGWRLSATLSGAAVPVLALEDDGLIVTPTVAAALRPGDLLRGTYCGEEHTLLLMVRAIESLAPTPPDGPAFRARCTAIWLQRVKALSALPAGAMAHLYLRPPEPEVVEIIAGPLPATSAEGPQWQQPCADSLPAGDLISLALRRSLPDAPAPGSLLSVTGSAEQWWLLAQEIESADDVDSPPDAAIKVTGPAICWRQAPPEPRPTSQPVIERLSLELWARHGQGDLLRAAGLGFGPEHARFWGALPDDEQLFAPPASAPPPAWWAEAATPRFPVAGPADINPESFTFPVAMLALPEAYLPPTSSDKTALQRDGLERFSAGLFLDRDLARTTTFDLTASADFIRYQSETPRALTGIHAALAIEEATLIAVPDAVHPGWELAEPPPPPPPRPVAPLPRPEWWRFQGCQPLTAEQLAPAPAWGNFLDCDIRVIAPPMLRHDAPDPTGTFTLYWESPEPGARYVLEESSDPGFEAGSFIVYEGPDLQKIIYGRPPGNYYYHVRLESGGNRSDWSEGVVVSVIAAGSLYRLDPAPGMQATLATIHRALLRLCAARGDLMAVLSLPEHYREQEALLHVELLRPSAMFTPPRDGALFTLPLGFGEAKALSYGALYHPWLVDREENVLHYTPPDGAMCGLIARRTLARGAWIAPANERLNEVIALTPPIGRSHRLSLLEAQVNLVRQEPHGFMPLSADTLSLDAELRPINVRRLLILLRRLAVRLGAELVFEPYDDVFRRAVQRSFESRLEYLFTQGAFAGKTPASSFQVVVASTPQDRDQGRFIVELRVAPSQPLTFLVVRLVQSGDRSLVTEGAP